MSESAWDPSEPEYRHWLVEVLMTKGLSEFNGEWADHIGINRRRLVLEAITRGHILWNQTRRKYKLSAKGLQYIKNDDTKIS